MARMDPSCWSGCTSMTPTAAAKPRAWSAATRPAPSRAPLAGSPTSSQPPPVASTPAPPGGRSRTSTSPTPCSLPGRPPGRRRGHAAVAGGLRPLRHPPQPRRGEDATLVFDEFSAIAGGREAAIQLVERVRDAGCASTCPPSRRTASETRRSSAAWSGPARRPAHPRHARSRDPPRAAGVVKVVEQTWRLDQAGPTGNSSARIGERPRIEPGRYSRPGRARPGTSPGAGSST